MFAGGQALGAKNTFVANLRRCCAEPYLLQVQASAPGAHDFPHPGRHTRRARASRLAPPPANSSAHVPETASTAAQALDLPDVASRQSDGATAQSQDHSQQLGGPATSGSAEAQAGASQQVDDAIEGGCNPDPTLQAREGTPVSSNRRHYRVSAPGAVNVGANAQFLLLHPGFEAYACG